MSQENNSEIVLIPLGNTAFQIETSIGAFSQPLADLLQHIGLPTENILSPIQERRKVIYALESTLEILPIEEGTKADYLSKFTVQLQWVYLMVRLHFYGTRLSKL